MLDLETFALRAKELFPKEGLRRKMVVLRQYDAFLESRGLKPGVESLNLWLDELIKKGKSRSTLKVYTYDVLNYFDVMMVDVDDRKLKLLKKRMPPREVRETDFLTDEEVARLISNTLSPVRRLIYALCFTYARRLGEVLSLTWDDVDLKHNTITFPILKKRREERATYELEPWIRELILKNRAMLGKNRLFELTERAVEITFKTDCRRAGIDPKGRNLRPHILRHSRITSLRNRGVPLDVVSKYLARHSRFDTTITFYRGITEEEKVSIPKAEEIFREVSQNA